MGMETELNSWKPCLKARRGWPQKGTPLQGHFGMQKWLIWSHSSAMGGRVMEKVSKHRKARGHNFLGMPIC